MKTLLAITDLTRMQHGHICIVGQDPEGQSIRPVLPPPGIPESLVVAEGQAIVFPFAVIELDLKQPRPQPPHTEDYLFGAYSVVFKNTLTEQQQRRVLEKSRFPSVAALFEQPITHDVGYHVADGQGPRSVGTVCPQAIHKIFYSRGEGEEVWNYHLGFYDATDTYYRLKITDLTWNYYCAAQRTATHRPTEIAEAFTERLKRSTCYLRVGLSRGWKKFPGRCFLQINGIYTFPNYLQGKTFAHFRPSQD